MGYGHLMAASVFRGLEEIRADLPPHAALPLTGNLQTGLVGVHYQEGRGRQLQVILIYQVLDGPGYSRLVKSYTL